MIPNTKFISEKREKKEEDFFPIDKEKEIVILCPFTGNQLSSKICSTCTYCQKFQGKHQSNRTLTSLICLYGQNNGSDESES